MAHRFMHAWIHAIWVHIFMSMQYGLIQFHQVSMENYRTFVCNIDRHFTLWNESRCHTLIRAQLERFGLCCLMTPGHSKDIRCHVWPYFFQTCKSPDQTSCHTYSWLTAWWLHMVTLIFLSSFVGMYGKHTHFITPKMTGHAIGLYICIGISTLGIRIIQDTTHAAVRYVVRMQLLSCSKKTVWDTSIWSNGWFPISISTANKHVLTQMRDTDLLESGAKSDLLASKVKGESDLEPCWCLF